MKHIGGLFLLLLGIVAGLKFPDLDLKFYFLGHRSILTHSFIVPLLLFLFVRQKEEWGLRLFSVGFSLAYVIHLCFDLIPRAWRGFALIYVPFYGRISPLLSWLWIAVSIIICLYLALLLINSVWDIVIFSSSTVGSFIFYAVTEAGFVSALIVLLLAVSITFLFPSDISLLLKKHIQQTQKIDT